MEAGKWDASRKEGRGAGMVAKGFRQQEYCKYNQYFAAWVGLKAKTHPGRRYAEADAGGRTAHAFRAALRGR
jgi:hypothetical protein